MESEKEVPRSGGRIPEEDEEAKVGAAVAKFGIFAMIVGLFLSVLRMIRGRVKPSPKTN